MKSAIEKILSAHQILSAFRENEHYSVKLTNEPFMSLIIEKHGKQIIVAHYFEQHGDLVPDPDLEYADLGGKEWLPVAIQHSTGHYVRAAEMSSGGHWKYDPRLMNDLRLFSRMWARNLIAQGYDTAKLVRAEVA